PPRFRAAKTPTPHGPLVFPTKRVPSRVRPARPVLRAPPATRAQFSAWPGHMLCPAQPGPYPSAEGSPMSFASPIAFLSPVPDSVAAARARTLGGGLFVVAGVIRLLYAALLDSDSGVLLTIGGVVEAAALCVGFLLLLRGGVPGTSTGSQIAALVLAGIYAVQ